MEMEVLQNINIIDEPWTALMVIFALFGLSITGGAVYSFFSHKPDADKEKSVQTVQISEPQAQQ